MDAVAVAGSLAEQHYRIALQLAEEVGDLCAEAMALRSLGEALTPTGRYKEALGALERAADPAVEPADPEGEMWAVARIGWTQAWMGRADEGVVERLWDLAEQDRPDDAPAPPGVSAQPLNLPRGALAALLLVTNDYRRTVEVLRRTSMLGDKRVVANAEFTRGRELLSLPRAEEAAAGGPEEAMPLAERADFTRNLADGMLVFDVLYTARGDLDRSLEWAERGLALAERLDNQEMIASFLGRIGLNRFYQGEWREARAYYERGMEMMRSLGPSLYSARLPCYLGMLSMAEGSWNEAARLLEEATALSEEVRWSVIWIVVQILRAQLDLAQGHPRAALARLEPLVDAPELNWTNTTNVLTVLGQTYLDLGDAVRAREASERARREAEELHVQLDAVGTLRVKGMAQSLQGYRDERPAPWRRRSLWYAP